MTKLSDTQCILLSSASQRADGSIMPLPTTLSGGSGMNKAVNVLIARGLAEELETGSAGAVFRSEGDILWGVYITPAGAVAIGVSAADDALDSADAADIPTASASPIAKGPTKTALVVSLLERAEGGTLSELIAATGWLPHTTRAALTGIRKKGHAVERSKRGDVTCYRIIR